MTIPLNRVRIPGRPLTANKLRKCTPRQAARLIRETREAATRAWRAGPNRSLIRPVWVDVEPFYPNRRSLPDVAGIAPAFKAALDGLLVCRKGRLCYECADDPHNDGIGCGRGALEDDGPAYVRGVTFHPARIETSDGNPHVWTPAGRSPNGGMILTIRGDDERCPECRR